MAFEPLLTSFRPERILGETPGLLVVDKPVNLAVHGGDEALAGDLVSRLREFLRSRGESDYLGVHQRLDAATSGVIAFTRDREANLAMAEGGLDKRYVALVELSPEGARRLPLGREVLLEHELDTQKGRSRVVTRGGKLARSRATLRRREGSLGLCELTLLTGRTHQLRVQLAAIGAPLLGDALYGPERRAPALRLMLHARSLSFADGPSFEAPLPALFERALLGRGLELGDASEACQALCDAGSLRAPLARQGDCFRLVNDAGDALPGVTVDRYGDFAVLSVASAAAEALAPALAAELVTQGARGVYLKRRARADLRRADHAELAPSLPLAGEAAPERLVVREGELSFEVELGSGLSSGLFLDQRDNRARIAQLARGVRLLNLFSYTCSFSVAAAHAGAARVVSVDLSARALEWGRANFAANGLPTVAHEFVRADALAWMKKAAGAGERFELVVLDPPSFSSEGGGKAFSVEGDYGRAAELAIRLLSRGGRLLCVTNHRKTTLGKLRRTLREAAERAGRSIAQLKDLPSQLDCPPSSDGPSPSKSVLVTLSD